METYEPTIHPPDPTQPFDVPPTVTTGADATVRVEAESVLAARVKVLEAALLAIADFDAYMTYSGLLSALAYGFSECRRIAREALKPIDPTSTPLERTETDES
jgi:hypothetical protein